MAREGEAGSDFRRRRQCAIRTSIFSMLKYTKIYAWGVARSEWDMRGGSTLILISTTNNNTDIIQKMGYGWSFGVGKGTGVARTNMVNSPYSRDDGRVERGRSWIQLFQRRWALTSYLLTDRLPNLVLPWPLNKVNFFQNPLSFFLFFLFTRPIDNYSSLQRNIC